MRHYTPEIGRRFKALGTADDIADADGEHVLSFAQAQAAAREWFAALARHDGTEGRSGPDKVADALADYVADYERRGGKAKRRLEWTIEAHIKPELGDLGVEALTRRRLELWHAKLGETAPRLQRERGTSDAMRPIRLNKHSD